MIALKVIKAIAWPLALVLVAAIAAWYARTRPPEPVDATIAAKQNESCLADHKCKIIVRKWIPTDSSNKAQGGNIYYRCLVTDTFHNTVAIDEHVMLDVDESPNCERISP